MERGRGEGGREGRERERWREGGREGEGKEGNEKWRRGRKGMYCITFLYETWSASELLCNFIIIMEG